MCMYVCVCAHVCMHLTACSEACGPSELVSLAFLVTIHSLCGMVCIFGDHPQLVWHMVCIFGDQPQLVWHMVCSTIMQTLSPAHATQARRPSMLTASLSQTRPLVVCPRSGAEADSTPRHTQEVPTAPVAHTQPLKGAQAAPGEGMQLLLMEARRIVHRCPAALQPELGSDLGVKGGYSAWVICHTVEYQVGKVLKANNSA